MQLPTNIIKVDYEGLEALVKANPANDDIFGGQYPGRLYYLLDSAAREETHYVAVIQGTFIVGVGSVWKNPSQQHVLTHVSVDDNYRQLGHGRRIIDTIFNDLVKSGAPLVMTRLSEDGKKWLARSIPRMHQNYPELAICWDDEQPHQLTYGYQPYQLSCTRHSKAIARPV